MNKDLFTQEENDNRIIDITPQDHSDVMEQPETENPIIIIESDDEEESTNNQVVVKTKRSIWKYIAMLLCVTAVIAIGGYLGWNYYRHNYYVGMPVSCSPSENIAKLERTPSKVTPEVVFTQDSIGSVALNMYEIRGLKAELSFDEPDTTQTDVYLYSRCADYGKHGKILGSMVQAGKLICDDNTRLGYCAMVGGNTVIGIARNEAVRDYAMENNGYFFRQFILVSNGEIPHVFHLHKKVERRALARMDDHIYYIESRHAETMWDFADAIRRYGFIDAIYITGGDQPSYYRTSDGERHLIGNPDNHPSERNKKLAPYIIFRK